MWHCSLVTSLNLLWDWLIGPWGDQLIHQRLLIGILQWVVKLWYVDIIYEVQMLPAWYLIRPWFGHLNTVYIFVWLFEETSVLVILLLVLHCWRTSVSLHLWSVNERILSWYFAIQSREVYAYFIRWARYWDWMIGCFPYYQSCYKDKPCWHYPTLHMHIMCPVTWYFKILNAVESATPGSEFIIGRITVDLIEIFVYKLIYFGICVMMLFYVISLWGPRICVKWIWCLLTSWFCTCFELIAIPIWYTRDRQLYLMASKWRYLLEYVIDLFNKILPAFKWNLWQMTNHVFLILLTTFASPSLNLHVWRILW
jgi:hypothetical protein